MAARHRSPKPVKGEESAPKDETETRYVKTAEALSALCRELAAEPFVTIDTEFVRDNTYWPHLCLIQVAGPSGVRAIIDPLAKIELKPFFSFLVKSDPVKVFHAARQDLEIFWHLGGVIPTPLYDTQIAAMVCGYGESVGYETLVRAIAKAQIDKSARFTDWRRRPLTDKQLSYAIADVTHLCTVYEVLKARIEKQNRISWIDEEMAKLTDPATYDLSPEIAWQRLKLRDGKPRTVALAVTVAAWREREAQARDVPRGRVLKDEVIAEVLNAKPTSKDDLERLRGLPRGWANSDLGKGLIAAVKEGLELPPEGVPRVEITHREHIAHARIDLLKTLLRARSEEHNVAQKLIGTTSDLEALATRRTDGLALKEGWRYELFGRDAEQLLSGDAALVLDGDHVRLVEHKDAVKKK